MLNAYKKSADSDLSYAQPENANLSTAGADTPPSPAGGALYQKATTTQIPYIDLLALVIDDKVALKLTLDGGSVVSLGEPDTLEITGPPGLQVELRVADIVDGNGVTLYKVAGSTNDGSVSAPWTRNASNTGTRCSLQVPSDTQENWIKFTIAASPCVGSLSTPLSLDPITIVRKEG